MAKREPRKIRRGQTITPYGVGAILDISGQSFIATDTSEWTHEPVLIEETALIAQKTGVRYLRTPPEFSDSSDSSDGVHFVRFPKLLFCPDDSCRRITDWGKLNNEGKKLALNEGAPLCRQCDKKKVLVPMRFIQVCANGHIEDVWWWGFTHGKSDNCQTQLNPKLKFGSTEGSSGGLNSLYVQCEDCGGRRFFNELDNWKPHCKGRQPWFKHDDGNINDCEERMKVIQRGASNAHFPEIISVLDIQEVNDASALSNDIGPLIKVNNYFTALLSLERASGIVPVSVRQALIVQCATDLATTTECESLSIEEIKSRIEEELDKEMDDGITDHSEEDFRREEWEALRSKGIDGTGLNQRQIKTKHILLDPFQNDYPLRSLVSKFDSLIQVKRLREIRVLKGFWRLTMNEMVPANITDPEKDAPAIDVYGEGIFLTLDEELLREWESQHQVKTRVDELATRRNGSFFSKVVPELTPRFVLIHTLSHILIRELMYGSGYDGSAIQERIYAAPAEAELPMSGLLLCTTDGDSSGTLGGLVRLGRGENFFPMLSQALMKAQWCSFDPVCRESKEQGVDGLSKAACHACSLVGETSCRAHNSGLDRNLLIDPEYGYFRDVFN